MSPQNLAKDFERSGEACRQIAEALEKLKEEFPPWGRTCSKSVENFPEIEHIINSNKNALETVMDCLLEKLKG